MATYARLPGQDEVSFQKFHSSSRLRIILCCGEWWPRRTRTLQRWAYLSNGSRTMLSSRHEVFPSVRLYSRSEFRASGASPSSLAHVQVRAIHTPTVGYPVLEAPASPQAVPPSRPFVARVPRFIVSSMYGRASDIKHSPVWSTTKRLTLGCPPRNPCFLAEWQLSECPLGLLSRIV